MGLSADFLPKPVFMLVLWSCFQIKGAMLYKLDALTKVRTRFDGQTGLGVQARECCLRREQ